MIVGQLMKRYCKDLIYTYVGDVLVSINPFQNLPDIYNPKVGLMDSTVNIIIIEMIDICSVSRNHKSFQDSHVTTHICSCWCCL